ncbi:MAG TPA: GAF domain-containing SpoIIE family protein phosphatase [Sinomonas sp.]|nr:GAF domain-containing SpoIIE family protein phosphatase [Sinomonas sp.]
MPERASEQSGERLAALASLGLVGSGSEERFDRITRAAQELFGVPVAAVNLLDDQYLYTKSPQPAGRTVRPRPETFCDVTVAADELTVSPDTAADPRFASKPDVAGGRGVRFYAGRPLHVDGQPVGTLCLYDSRPREFGEEALRHFDEMGTWAERELLDSREIEQAVTVQQALLPTADPAAPAYAIAATSMQLKGVGGDFYSWRLIDGALELTVADVMGKGIAAGLMAATVRAVLMSQEADSPASQLAEAGRVLAADVEATGIFATVFHARLETDSGAIAYSDAGHGLSLLVRADGRHEQLRGSGLPLGLEFDAQREDEHTVLEPGDTLVSFTDGVLELHGGTLGALDKIAALTAASRRPRSIVEAVTALTAEAAPEDDITVLALHRVRSADEP